MNELLLILAISVIIIGFLILVGVAIWLAMERRRLTATPQQRSQSQPAAQPKPAPPAPAAPPKDATPPVAATTPATAEDKGSGTPPKEPAHHKDVLSSGEYPSAALYDQTLLPQPPKKRTKSQPK